MIMLFAICVMFHSCHVSFLSCPMCVQYHAFSFINSIIQSIGYSEAEKQQLQEEALHNLEDLVSIDCKQAATTVMSSLASSLRTVISKLKAKENILFEFLQGVMAYRWVGVVLAYWLVGVVMA